MDGAILNRTARTAGLFPTAPQPVRESTSLFSVGIWPVALFSAIGLAVALGLSHASPCTGIDLNAGCVPIELTGQQ